MSKQSLRAVLRTLIKMYTFAPNFKFGDKMNINEEGKYYASMVRKFRTEYKSKSLHGFCKEQIGRLTSP